MSNQNPAHVVTNKVRLSYCNLFTPKAKKPGDEPKYSTTLLIPKSDVATRQRIDAAIGFAIQEGTASKWNGVRPPIVPVPIHDGDGVRPSDGMPFEDECKGHWVMTASDKNRPEVVDLNLNPIINQSDVYSGMYARVSIRFFAYVNNGKKGIGCGLGNVQKLEDGVPLSGGRTSANEDFGGAPAYPQQVYQQPPIQTGYQQPAYVPQQQAYTPQGYQQPPQPAYSAVQPVYPLQQPVQIDPITGKPLMGNVMGL
jgi:hypothetical protein